MNPRYRFYKVQAGVLVYPDEEIEGGVASGGENLELSVFGLDPNSSYACRFFAEDTEVTKMVLDSVFRCFFTLPSWPASSWFLYLGQRKRVRPPRPLLGLHPA